MKMMPETRGTLRVSHFESNGTYIYIHRSLFSRFSVGYLIFYHLCILFCFS